MVEKETIEARRLHSDEATEFEEEVTKLVERWKYLLKLPWNIEVFAVTHTVQLTGLGEEAVIHMEDDSKAKLEITMDDRHPYELEKLVVHELLHLPCLELEHKIRQNLPKTIGKKEQEEIFSNGPFTWDEVLIDYWAETLVCLAHGFYPLYHTPPEDSFFDPERRLALDLRIYRDKTGEYKTRTLKVPMSELPQIYATYKMSGLL
jgi:hypothetical protein